MFAQSHHTLLELKNALQNIDALHIYNKALPQMSNATIGQHTRHIIELYQCMLDGYTKGMINYENRKRDYTLEHNIETAITAIEDILGNLEKKDKPLYIEAVFQEENNIINSTYHREVLYNLEHCIHHQALIKVALVILNANVVTAQFGVAPSTLKYREQCAQ
jgi:hypothetical protein